MSVILSKDGGAPGAYALVVDDIPAEQAAQLHTEVTALVFGFRFGKDNTAKAFSDSALEEFIVQMSGHFDNHIVAIKAIRALTQLGLRESKDFVDDVVRRRSVVFHRQF